MSYIQAILNGTNKDYDSSLGTTMAWIYFLVVILIVAVVAGVLSAYIFYQRKET